MKNKFDIKFSAAKAEGKKIQLMAHMLAGYPSVSVNKETAWAMEQAGADYLELQLPFSDPLADGPVIMRGNHHALKKNFSLEKGFRLIEDLASGQNMPIFVMSYYNLPFVFGLEKFMGILEQVGVSGVIIPDIPFDDESEEYIQRMSAFKLHAALVISPGTSSKRLKAIGKKASGFVYTTLRTGITGAKQTLSHEGLTQFKKIRRAFPKKLALAAGFGISRPEHVKALEGKVDIAVIGSKLILLTVERGPLAVGEFISSIVSSIVS